MAHGNLCVVLTCTVCRGGNTLVSCGLLYTGEKEMYYSFFPT